MEVLVVVYIICNFVWGIGVYQELEFDYPLDVIKHTPIFGMLLAILFFPATLLVFFQYYLVKFLKWRPFY
jgi:hypothetical protein